MTPLRVLSICVMAASFAVWFDAPMVCGQEPPIYLQVENDIARPGNLVPLEVYIETQDDSVRAFQIELTLDRPDLMTFSPDSSSNVPVITAGTLIEEWEYIEARAISPSLVRITAIANTDLDVYPPPLLPFSEGILVKVVSEVVCDVSDTLQDRTTITAINPNHAYFSDSSGDLIEPVECTDGWVVVSFTQRGDMDGNGFIDALDLSHMINGLFGGAGTGCPPYVADFNCDGFPNVIDLHWLIDYMLSGGPPPPC